MGRRIDEWFEAFEAEEARKEAAAKAAGEGDDGWTVVEAKRGRRKTTDDEGTAGGGIRAATADANASRPSKFSFRNVVPNHSEGSASSATSIARACTATRMRSRSCTDGRTKSSEVPVAVGVRFFSLRVEGPCEATSAWS